MTNENNVKSFQADLQSLNSNIKTFLSLYYSEEELTIELEEDPNSKQLSNEYNNILSNLVEATYKVDYLSKPILDQGILSYHKETDRYMFVGEKEEFELHAGYPIEVLITNYIGETYWQKTSIEYSHQPENNHSHKWYLVASKKTPLEGLPARNRLIH